MAEHKNTHPTHPLPEHKEEGKVKDALKISKKEIPGNVEFEKERGFKEGLADNSNNEPPGKQQK